MLTGPTEERGQPTICIKNRSAPSRRFDSWIDPFVLIQFSPPCLATINHFLWAGIKSVWKRLARIIFSTLIDYSFAANKVIVFSLKVCRLNIREVRRGDFPGHWGGNSWAGGIGLGGLVGAGSSWGGGVGGNPIPKALDWP